MHIGGQAVILAASSRFYRYSVIQYLRVQSDGCSISETGARDSQCYITNVIRPSRWPSTCEGPFTLRDRIAEPIWLSKSVRSEDRLSLCL